MILFHYKNKLNYTTKYLDDLQEFVARFPITQEVIELITEKNTIIRQMVFG